MDLDDLIKATHQHYIIKFSILSTSVSTSFLRRRKHGRLKLDFASLELGLDFASSRLRLRVSPRV